MRTKNKILIFAVWTALTIMSFSNVSALQINHIGTIDQSLFAPTSLSLSSDRLAVLEPFAKQLKIFSPDGIIMYKVNIDGSANGLSRLSESVYLFCNLDKKVINTIDINDSSQTVFGSGTAALTDPDDIFIYNDQVYILDAGKNSIEVFDKSAVHIRSIPFPQNGEAKIEYAGSFSYNPVIDRFYILDQLKSVIWVIDNNGAFIKTFGSYGSGDGEITRGGEILCTASGYVFVSDRYQNRITVFDYQGEFLDNIDVFDSLGTDLSTPTGMAADNNGLLYVSSTESKKIDIFHVETSSVSEAVTTSQTYPNQMDTVETINLMLTAEAEANMSARTITGFDFEMYSEYDLAAVIFEVVDNPVQSLTDTTLGIIHYSSNWNIGAQLQDGKSYQWRTRVHFEDQTTGEWTDLRLFTTAAKQLPVQFMLYQNYPNPFNPETTIKFSLEKEGQTKLEIINLLGQRIKTIIDETLPAGEHEVVWDSRNDNGSRAASGVYFYRLISGDNSFTRKLVLLK